jgi:hypothetical protein
MRQVCRVANVCSTWAVRFVLLTRDCLYVGMVEWKAIEEG